MKLKRPQLVSNGSLSRMLQSAQAAWDSKKFQEGIETLERASRLDPANASILLGLGNWHGCRYNYAAAEQCFEKAGRVAIHKAHAFAAAGMFCGDFRNYTMSERFFLRVGEQADATPKMLAQLATLYERQRRLDEAAAMVERALQMNGDHALALVVKARLQRQTGGVEAAEQTIRSIVTQPNTDVWDHAQAWYELGLILDRREKYDDAMAAFAQAKILLKPHAGRFFAGLEILRQRNQAMRENLRPEILQGWLDAGPSLPPPRRLAFLGGHPRSGTTLLEQVLDSHPGIISLDETDIFHDDAYMPLAHRLPGDASMLSVLEAAPLDALQQSRANYFRSAELYLNRSIGDRLLIDKNPPTTFLLPLLVRIFPEIKLLVALRDPRDVILSCFMQPIPLNYGSTTYLALERTVDEYIALMSLWQKLKPMLEGHYLEIRYEDMVNDLESVARKTLHFLGVAWDERVLRFDEHARKKVVRSPTYADVAQPVYKRAKGRWEHYRRYLEPYLPKLEPFVKAFGYE